MNNRFVVTLVAVIVVLFGIFWFMRDEAGAPNGDNSAETVASEHTVGEGSSDILLVEYGDFQCPACGGYYPILQQVKAQYGDQITFQFRHFPLAQIHQNAMAAHRAAEAAGLQGKFWEMHDILYEQQQTWQSASNANTVFESYAAQLELDMNEYKEDFASSQVNRTINADIAEGQKLGVNSTPTFFLDGEKLEEPPRDLEGFVTLIDEKIASKQSQENQ